MGSATSLNWGNALVASSAVIGPLTARHCWSHLLRCELTLPRRLGSASRGSTRVAGRPVWDLEPGPVPRLSLDGLLGREPRAEGLVGWYCPQYHRIVPSVAKIVTAMRANPRNIGYDDLAKVCTHYFGAPRTSGGSHAVFRTPWPGDPRVNIQNDHGKAKADQVRQVLAAIDKKEGTT